MTDYLSRDYTADETWQDDELVSDTDNPLANITIINDDDTNSISVKLNSNLNDAITVKAGEVITLILPVVRIFYRATAGTPALRVVSDGESN